MGENAHIVNACTRCPDLFRLLQTCVIDSRIVSGRKTGQHEDGTENINSSSTRQEGSVYGACCRDVKGAKPYEKERKLSLHSAEV